MEEKNKSGNKTKTAGIILSCIGLVGFFISIVVIVSGCSQMTNMDDPEHMGPVIVGGLMALVAFPIALIGLSILFAGINAEREQRDNIRGTRPSGMFLVGTDAEIQQTASSRGTGSSGMPLASMACGVFGILFYFFGMLISLIWVGFLFLPIPFSLLAIALGLVSLKRLGKNPSLGGRGKAVAGLVLGLILLIFSLWLGIMVVQNT